MLAIVSILKIFQSRILWVAKSLELFSDGPEILPAMSESDGACSTKTRQWSEIKECKTRRKWERYSQERCGENSKNNNKENTQVSLYAAGRESPWLQIKTGDGTLQRQCHQGGTNFWNHVFLENVETNECQCIMLHRLFLKERDSLDSRRNRKLYQKGNVIIMNCEHYLHYLNNVNLEHSFNE